MKWANERDHKACETYRYNIASINPKMIFYEGDIVDFHPIDRDIDILAGGFPCQPYSLAGRMDGLKDERAEPMFRQLVRVAVECNVRAIFMENVSMLKTLHNGEVFDRYNQILNENGYPFLFAEIYNTKDYGGVAQNRNRLYMVAFKNHADYKTFKEDMKKLMVKKEKPIGYWGIIDPSIKTDEKYYYSQQKMLRFNEDVLPVVTEIGTIYQYRRTYTRKNMNGLCPALTASMGGGGHNVPLIKDEFGIRKLTPKECLAFQGFPKDYDFPDIADSYKYKQTGNSVSVPVVARIAEILVESLKKND